MVKDFRGNFQLLLIINVLCVFSPLMSFEIRHQFRTEIKGYGHDFNINGEKAVMQHFLKPENVVFDVGANRGEWSQLALEKAPTIRLFSFEPLPVVFENLKMRFLSFDNVYPFNFAFSDEQGKATFYYYTQFSELSGFHDRPVLREVLGEQFSTPEAISVSLETLDYFCSSYSISGIDFLKIDTEGAEWKVLNGAKNLLMNHRIHFIQFEYGGCYIDSKTTLKQVIRFLTENHYVIFKIIPEGLIHISRWDASLENYEYSNYFAAYKEDMPGYTLVEFSK